MDGLAEFWTAIATRYKDVPASALGYNFNNEPCTIDCETYNTLIQRLTDAVRAVDKDKWITIDIGDGWANSDFVFGTKHTGDPKTTYNYHLYYWHHDRDQTQGRRPELLFPQYSDGDPFGYRNTQNLYNHRIQDALLYAIVNKVPVWCGEFGASPNCPNQEMLIQTEEFITFMERFGHGWSWWNWDGQNYGRTGLQDGDEISLVVLVLKRFMHRKGAY